MSQIALTVDGAGVITTTGGIATRFEQWRVDDGNLDPVAHEYTLPRMTIPARHERVTLLDTDYCITTIVVPLLLPSGSWFAVDSYA